MIEQKTIMHSELAKFGSIATLNEQAISLVEQQCSVWETARTNYAALKNIQTKTFDFGHFKIIAQFNLERIRSSAAKTDAKSIAARPCFLCIENLPPEQKGIVFQNKYLILVNPFPIFPLHLTISHVEHTQQRILDFFHDLLKLSKSLSNFTVFYNGPQTGASAPDHFHFQAGSKGFLPFESEFQNLVENHSETIYENGKTKIVAVENYLRRFISIISDDENEISSEFESVYNKLKISNDEEPMLNVLSNFENGKWRVIVFPRDEQRPSHFFRTHGKQIVVSPAAVELGGVLVLPREEDFNQITEKEVAEIYKEVTINKEAFDKLISTAMTLRKTLRLRASAV